MNFRPSLAKLKCPVSVLGGKDDPIAPSLLAEELAAHTLNADTELHLYDNCGHGAFRDKPGEVLKDIMQFIRGL